MPRDDRQIHIAASGDLTHAACPGAFDEAAKELDASIVAQRTKELRVEHGVNWPLASECLQRSHGFASGGPRD